MHAFRIIQAFLTEQCSTMHAKRRHCLAQVVAASATAGLGVVKLGRKLASKTSLRHRIKCCDRLLSNAHLARERVMVYRAMARQVLSAHPCVAIVVDWSVLRDNGSAQLLRAAAVVQGRAFMVYEEVHPCELLGSPAVQRSFMQTVRDILPPTCRPVIITDAGFRAPWFKMLNELGYAWIGRIRNRDMVRAHRSQDWRGCKTLYAKAGPQARDLGQFSYTRSNPTSCRLVLAKRQRKGRQAKSKAGNAKRSSHNKKISAGQREPWLLAVAPALASLDASQVVNMYAGRMQIEQAFRDLKNNQWGMGLRNSQTRALERLASLLLIGALLAYALWLIGLAALEAGFNASYGSRAKSTSTLSILSLARQWLEAHHRPPISRRQLKEALIQLILLVQVYEF